MVRLLVGPFVGLGSNWGPIVRREGYDQTHGKRSTKGEKLSLEDAPPPEDKEPGYKPDPLRSKKLRYWDGSKWTLRTALPPGSKSGPPNWMVAIGIVIGVIVVIAVLASGEDTGSDSSDKPEPPSMAAAKASGTCPGQMYVGLPEILRFRVTNPGKVAWPATYVAFSDGSGPFVRNGATSDGVQGIDGDDYGFQGGWQFRGVLKPGESRGVKIMLTPKDAGNFDPLEIAFWGNVEDEKITPYDRASSAVITCDDIAINPGF